MTEVKSQYVIENNYIEKAKKFVELSNYDSSIFYLNQVTNKKFNPIKKLLLLKVYCCFNEEKMIIDFFNKNSSCDDDFNYYYNVAEQYLKNKSILKNIIKTKIETSFFNVDEVVSNLNYIDQLVRNKSYMFRTIDAENNVDKFTFTTFKKIFLNNIKNIDTSKLLNLDVLMIHWSQINEFHYDSIINLYDTLLKYELVLPNSYIRAKEILFFKRNKLSYFGISGINSLLGIPNETKIEFFEPKSINERRRKVGLLDL